LDFDLFWSFIIEKMDKERVRELEDVAQEMMGNPMVDGI
jgi:hypothetical protein